MRKRMSVKRSCTSVTSASWVVFAGCACPKKAAEARERAVREMGPDCDAETLDAAEFALVFTTVQHELSAAQVLDLYRARWQVELDFKRAKTIRGLDCLPNFLPETIYSWICAKLLLQLIAMRIASRQVAASPESPKSESSLPSRTRQRRLAAAVAEPWYVAKLVWDVVCGALLPVALHDIPQILDRLVKHIRRVNERQRRPRQLDVIRRLLGSCGPR